MRGRERGGGVSVGGLPGVVLEVEAVLVLSSGDCPLNAEKMPATISNNTSKILAPAISKRRLRLGLFPPLPPPWFEAGGAGGTVPWAVTSTPPPAGVVEASCRSGSGTASGSSSAGSDSASGSLLPHRKIAGGIA